MIAYEQPSAADLDVIHGFLTETYWSPGIPREIVERACANSICAIARNDAGALIGFARAVSDRATFAWVADVMVLPAHRGKGLGRALVASLQAHPELQNLRRWVLGTRDAHGVYAALGFTPLGAPDRYMEIRKSAPYGNPSG
ncbi:MAG: GNAT family N-acetyltransferase [Alphaproteobacteria bacterium]